jgi:hypothetical protein
MFSLWLRPKDQPSESWTLADWDKTLFLHFFVSPPAFGRVNRLHVSAEELRAAVGTTSLSGMNVRDLFINAVRKAKANRSLGSDAERRAAHWNTQSADIPPFLSHLLLTCLVANDLAEELRAEGDFRKRLTTILNGGVHHGLERLRPLWEELSAWLSYHHERLPRVATLKLPVIPSAGHYSIIGYPLRLSIPSRKDQRLLTDMLAKSNLAGTEPPVREVVNLFQSKSTKFSPLYCELFREFVDGMKTLSRTTLAQTSFWMSVREIALSISPFGETAKPEVQTRVEMEDDDGHFWLYVTCDREVRLKGYDCLALPTARRSAYHYALHSGSGDSGLADRVFRHESLGENEALVHSLRIAVDDGVVLFVEDDDNVDVFTPNIPSGGRLSAIVSDRVATHLEILFYENKLKTNIKTSRYSGWTEWRDLDSEDLQRIDFSKSMLLAGLKCFRQTLPLPQIRLRGGIRTGDSYLALSGWLPRVEIQDADRVSLLLEDRSPLNLVAEGTPTKVWKIPGGSSLSQLVGQHCLAAYHSSFQVAEKVVSFVGDVLETRYKRPSMDSRWFSESGLEDVSIFEGEHSLAPWDTNERPAFPLIRGISSAQTTENDRLNIAVTAVAASLVTQRGISERDLTVSLKETLNISWNNVWPTLRGWVESGMLDCFVDLRWRARFYFGREPELVVYHDSESPVGVLAGLVPSYLRHRFAEMAKYLGLEVVERSSLSTLVPALPCCRAKSFDLLITLARELELPEIKWLHRPAEIANSLKQIMLSHLPEPEHWPVYKYWDWHRLAFAEVPPAEAPSHAALHWCRRDDGPDCYKIYQDRVLVWWTRSRTWGILAAMMLAEMPAFRLTPGGDIITAGSGIHLPLPLGRFLAIVGNAPSGPVKNETSTEYQYFPSNRNLAHAILNVLYRQDVPHQRRLPPALDKLFAACSITRVGSIPMPAALSVWLRQFRDSKRFSVPRRVPINLLPQFYAQMRASEEREQ